MNRPRTFFAFALSNTASGCSFTSQYEGLEAFHAKRGLVILGFPVNVFGQQEPGSAALPAAIESALRQTP